MNGIGLDQEDLRCLEIELQTAGVVDKLTRALVIRCNVPLIFAPLELEDMRDDGDAVYRVAITQLAKIGDELADAKPKPKFIYLRGIYGTGKTRVAAWLVRRAYPRVAFRSSSEVPYFITSSSLADVRFEQRVGPNDECDHPSNERRWRAFHAPLLAIDDVGRFVGFRGEQEFIERVIDERIMAGRSTVVTSNLRDEELPDRFREVLGTFTQITLSGTSRRTRG